MKPTLSRDGELRFELKVKFRIGRQELIDALSLHLYHETGDERFNRSKLLKITNAALWKSGSALWADAEEVSSAKKEQAIKIVDAMFPELLAQN